MKTLRAFVFTDLVLLALAGLGLALLPALSSPAALLERGIAGGPGAALSLGAAGVGVLAVALWLASDLPLIGHRRRLALRLGGANLLIAVLALAQSLTGRGMGMLLESALGLVFSGLAILLFRVGLRAPRPGVNAAEIAGLKIPDEVRQALLQQTGEAAAQEERNRLARDLHDSIKQQLFSITIGIAAAQERWEKDPEGARKALADVRGSAREAMVEMQAMLHQLRPEPLGTAGLIEALREQCEALGYRSGADVALELGEPIPDDRMPLGAQDTLFRIGQEMLANAVRHARARHIRLRLGRQGEALTLAVEDDGQGFDPTAPVSGSGLRNLKERAVSLGGSLKITDRLGGGTRAQLWAPLAPAAAVSARGLREKSWLLNWGVFSMIFLSFVMAPRILLSPFSFSYFFVVLILLVVAVGWLDVRGSRRTFTLADLASYRYAVHRARALMSLVGAWLAYQSSRLPGGWGIASRPLILLFLALLGADLLGSHRWSRANLRPIGDRKRPSQGGSPNLWRKILIFFLLPPMVVFSLALMTLNHEFWTRPEQLVFFALAAALLVYFLWRRPRTEGASS